MATYQYIYTGSVQNFVVPTAGTYDITAYGGSGGVGGTGPFDPSQDTVSHAGGLGAEVSGRFTLAANERLKIIVGGYGRYASGSYSGGGGGGGTFVLGSTDNGKTYALLLVAGGGGGGSPYGPGGPGTTGAKGDGSGGATNTSGFKGGYAAGGGAGVRHAGYSSPAKYAGGQGGSNGAGHYAGGAGGAYSDSSSSSGGAGGFGGGGGGGGYSGGGGGGGYTGGAASNKSGAIFGYRYGGYGGTSYDAGTLLMATRDGVNSGYGMLVISQTACFAAGTLIRTARGAIAVEALEVGDLAVTSSGAHRPIRWLGHRVVDCRRHGAPSVVMPIRIAPHAFGEGRPERDLLVSPGHAICVDVLGEVLIPAIALVNGSTIQQVDVDIVTYWHVELDSHAIILAENLPTESYIDCGNRSFFVEAGVTRLDSRPDAQPATMADYCRPFHIGGDLVEVVRGRLEALGRHLPCRAAPADRACRLGETGAG